MWNGLLHRGSGCKCMVCVCVVGRGEGVKGFTEIIQNFLQAVM